MVSSNFLNNIKFSWWSATPVWWPSWPKPSTSSSFSATSPREWGDHDRTAGLSGKTEEHVRTRPEGLGSLLSFLSCKIIMDFILIIHFIRLRSNRCLASQSPVVEIWVGGLGLPWPSRIKTPLGPLWLLVCNFFPSSLELSYLLPLVVSF